MKFVLASNNKHKIAEIKSILSQNGCDIEISSLADIGYTEEIVEDGTTFEENALIKARAVATLGYIGIADDSGLCVEALNGEPGIYSARYAGEPCDHTKNNAKILKALEGIPMDRRGAAFVSVIACAHPNGSCFTVRGECHGVMLEALQGEGGFGYDPLFQPDGYACTFAELTFDEKNKISHRAKALTAFAESFPAFLKKHTF
ncbi:MAG: XTP/dITP diphosphatase [Clostridia bacterium]|nr:XTP/dITP diphosphatase [Clostridia bacterium]